MSIKWLNRISCLLRFACLFGGLGWGWVESCLYFLYILFNFPGKLGENIFEDIRKSFTELCTLLSWNIYFETRLNGTYGRIFRLYYEKLALRPLETSMWLYKRLALRYTPKVRAHVHRLTRAGLPDECPTCAGRANSSAHVHSWKGLFNQSQLNDIEEVCGTYLKELGYSW